MEHDKSERDSIYSDTPWFDASDDKYSHSPQPDTPNGSRPGSQYSGSDYSQPQTPNEHPQGLLSPGHDISGAGNPFEDVSLNSRPASGFIDASSKPVVQPSTESERNSTTASSPRHSRDSSNYSRSSVQSQKRASTPTVPFPDITEEEAHMSMNSMHSMSFSESDYDYEEPTVEQAQEALRTPRLSSLKHSRKPSSLEILENVWETTWTTPDQEHGVRPDPPTRQSTLFDMSKDQPLTPTTPTSQPEVNVETEEMADVNPEAYSRSVLNIPQSRGSSLAVMDSSAAWRTKRTSSLWAPTQVPDIYEEEEDEELDWSTLDKVEEQEKEDKDLPEGVEDESTQFLLARLEQENAKYTADPKSSSAPTNGRSGRSRTQTRPPSMAMLKKLVSQQDTPSIRFSLVSDRQSQIIEEPPPMTELEFWAAIVQDYPSTAMRLPTLTTTKIRAGIPIPLRGVVWTAMSGARDKSLEEAFETLKDEESPYEGIILKDVGRSFPGVELFRDAEGEGQKMLGRVLKCFSLHDTDIGYCQGLGFLVGPLLMNMGEKEAFCVLVRLMEHYALRPSFLPSLAGLHMRIFQFSVLLNQHQPRLADHLGALGIEPAYLSQWFLSLFAVTCPLPMLFRIYDIIFAEGANETVMRVALALFRRNEEKMMAFTEFEEIMQLLLGRQLWDVYGCDADALVDDFTSLGNIITHARLAELEREFESKGSEAAGQTAGFLPDVQAAASRFLGRLWTQSHGHSSTKSTSSTLAPASAEKEAPTGGYLSRPASFLRRSPSKQSLGAINDSASSEGSASSVSASGHSTAPTETDLRDSISMKSKSDSIITIPGSTSTAQGQHMTAAIKVQELQTEIEDLLMALSEMQREQATTTSMLQKEREERNDDHRVVRQLLSKLTNGESDRKASKRSSMPPPSRPASQEIEKTSVAEKRRTMPPRPKLHVRTGSRSSEKKIVVDDPSKKHEIDNLVQDMQVRLETNTRFSASFETRAQLRSALARAREQLATAETQIKDLSERAGTSESSLIALQTDYDSLISEVEELRTRVNEDFKAKQNLELRIENLQIQMRMEARALEKKERNANLARADSSGEIPTLKRGESPTRPRQGSLSSNPSNPGGLRDLKLGARDSMTSTASTRSIKSRRLSDDDWPTPTLPPVEIPGSPPKSPTIEITPIAPLQPVLPTTTSLTVPAPSGANFGRRTSSLATQEVFATTKHEPVSEEALLLELVNAKTAEATARQELDELKKSMQWQKKRAEDSLVEMQAAFNAAKMEAQRAWAEADDARQEARAARAEVFDASPLPTPLTPSMASPNNLPPTPAGYLEKMRRPSPPPRMATSPVLPQDSNMAESAASAASAMGSWLWGKRA